MLLHFQCINHPPLFLGWSLAFGQEARKHLARWTKLSELIHYLQILKTVALEKGHLSKEAGWGTLGGTFLHLFCYRDCRCYTDSEGEFSA